jgi:hypothetical protein
MQVRSEHKEPAKMKRLLLVVSVLFVVFALVLADSAQCGEWRPFGGRFAWRQVPADSSWHGNYYDPAWGTPVALVVPQGARRQVVYSWGVGGTRVMGIPNQYQPGYPSPGVDQPPGMFYPTPPWPTDTRQFGHYYIRAPR